MKVEEQQLKAFLIDSGLVSEKDFEKASRKALKGNKKIGDILVSDGLISEEQFIKLQAYILGIPFVNLEKEKIDTEVLKIIPEPVAKSNNIVAFRRSDDGLEVAMLDPKDLRTIDFIKKTSSLKILPRLTTPKSIKNVLKQYQETLEAEFGDIIKKEAGDIKVIDDDVKGKGEKELKEAAEEMPIIKIVDTLMKHAVLQRASDVHIEPLEKELIVRYRIDGILRDAMTLPKKTTQGVIARIKVLSNLKLDEHRLPQDGRFKIEAEDYKYSIRVSILPTAYGEKIVMRLLSESSKSFSLEELGILGDSLEWTQDALRKPAGMILITGPTGSGKTTTLYSMMEILNKPEVNISTVEDPIEYQMPRVNQTQIRADIGLTFAAGLRSLVRQDPDIIMVGEIRDGETVNLAINAALTGHKVLSTIHTTSAAGTIARLIDMGSEPFLISSTLNLVIAQRLVRRLCSSKEKYTLSAAEIKDISKFANLGKIEKLLKEEGVIKGTQTIKDVIFYRPKSCKESADGYKGRMGIYEILPITESIKEMIIRGESTSKINEQSQKEGMRSMVEDGFIKAAKGQTSIEEILRVIME
jgi:type IV pilus assembly protein PilB